MHAVRVECYSGYRADERPLRFFFGERKYEVLSVDDKWYSPGATFFRVLADDGNIYVLRHEEGEDTWSVEAFRARKH
jgi:hypothetical protein